MVQKMDQDPIQVEGVSAVDVVSNLFKIVRISSIYIISCLSSFDGQICLQVLQAPVQKQLPVPRL